ncbi:hypothetical protein HWB92_gp014 [Serratia phage vB_SmaA_3M]|uniref:Putative deoxyribonucleotidase n=1 Tax=Serratia phage vB_SmaA_3M TaxID=2419930 RepID=A0A3G2YS00_9CAUD|nr:hypothetical protein HWB92_gp014 [Serratia phage vB_SmaA_3M]AYP28272.1 putative deoxyribonucleotidase [Serratia phage vB_SmaA_3M]
MGDYVNGDISLPFYNVGVDIDLTIVDTLTPWLAQFNSLGSSFEAYARSRELEYTFRPITDTCYKEFKGDLCPLMMERAPTGYGFQPMMYWRDPRLYDKLSPLNGAVEFLTGLYRGLMGTGRFSDVRFIAVSKCEPEHERSKRQFVEREFRDMFYGFISTDDKHLVNLDMLIDDNPKYVVNCAAEGIFQIYVPQGNYEKFEGLSLRSCASGVLEHLTIQPVAGENHFDILNPIMPDIIEILMRHYDYVN